MSYLAAVAAGIGGLLVEMVLVRRHGLLLGNTSAAAGLVMALFLLGLGLGGLWVARVRGRPGRWAAGLYAAVAVASVAADAGLGALGSVAWPVGFALAAIAPGGIAVLMGAAFPLLFALQRPTPLRGAALVGANTAGSMVAAFAGGNFWIPEWGLGRTLWLGAGCYLVAALCAGASGRGLAPVAPRPVRGSPWLGAGPAFVAGALVLGHEVVLLRRLPFWLEGLQPTLSGVLAACLLASALGAWFLAPLVHRVVGRRGVWWVLGLGGAAVCVGWHELWVPQIARSDIHVDRWPGPEWQMHWRVVWAALVSSFVPLFLLGAVVPLQLARLRSRSTRAAFAGRLFFWNGLGAVAGAGLAGHLLPATFPSSYFGAAPIALTLLVLLVVARPRRIGVLVGLAGGVLAWAGVGGLADLANGSPPMEGARYDRPESFRHLTHRTDSTTTASVVYDRSQQSMVLFTDGFRAAETGPGTAYMRVLGHLPMLLREGLSDVAVIALGTGTTAEAVAVWPDPEHIDVVEISSAVWSVLPFFGGEGPAFGARELPAFARDPRTRVHLDDGRRFLARREPASLDLVTLEPLLPYAPGTAPLYSAEFYELARRTLRSDGLMVQWVPTHAMPVDYFETLLATFARGFPHTSVWLVDQSTVLVGSERPHVPTPEAMAARLAGLSSPVVAALHEAGLTSALDLQLAFVGDGVAEAFEAAPSLRDERPFLERVGYWSGGEKLRFYPENLDRLVALAEGADAGSWSPESVRTQRVLRLTGLRDLAMSVFDPAGAPGRAARTLSAVRSVHPDSVLLHREETRALRTLLENEVWLRDGEDVGALADRHLGRDPRSALLQAVSALPDVRRPRSESERARRFGVSQALAPELWREPPAFLAGIAVAGGDGFEALGKLPVGDELVARVTDGSAGGLALAAVFPVRTANAFVAAAERRRLSPAERYVLRPLLDPCSIATLTEAVRRRRGDLAAEVLPLWRSDLPMPSALLAMVESDTPVRTALAQALSEHRGARAQSALASLMMDPEESVRREAGLSLFRLWGDRIPYDPTWDETRRSTAAERVRSLHNRRP